MLSPSWGKLAFSPSAMRLSHALGGSTPVRSVTIGSSSRADAGRSGAFLAVVAVAVVVVVVVVVVWEEHDSHNHGPAKERTSQPPSRRRSQPAAEGAAPSPSPADAIDDHGPDNESRSARMGKIIMSETKQKMRQGE